MVPDPEPTPDAELEALVPSGGIAPAPIERPVAARLVVTPEYGDPWEATPADLDRFGYVSARQANKRMRTIVAAAARSAGVDEDGAAATAVRYVVADHGVLWGFAPDPEDIGRLGRVLAAFPDGDPADAEGRAPSVIGAFAAEAAFEALEKDGPRDRGVRCPGCNWSGDDPWVEGAECQLCGGDGEVTGVKLRDLAKRLSDQAPHPDREHPEDERPDPDRVPPHKENPDGR